MFQYSLWNHRVVSDFHLGELDPGFGGHTFDESLSIFRAAQRECAPPGAPPLFEVHFENGEVWFASWKCGDGYLVRFPGLCAFRISPGDMRIDCAPERGVAESTIAHLILDHAIPRLLSLTPGFIVFHASAIQIGHHVIAILGQSGQGKSTLASWFASQGFPLLTDDCLVVRWDEVTRQWLAQPSYQSVRLWPDSVDALGIADSDLREFAGNSSKRRTGREVDFRFASSGSPLAACFVMPTRVNNNSASSALEPTHSGPPELRSLSVNEAFPALTSAVFRTDPGDPRINRREFEVLTSITDAVRFWSLRYERKYSWLPEVQNVIISEVERTVQNNIQAELKRRSALYESF